MRTADARRGVAAAMAVVAAAGMDAGSAHVLHDSNRLAVRVLPCDVVARVAGPEHEAAALEVTLAQLLAATGSPVGVLDPRAEAHVHERDGFTVTLWTYYEQVPTDRILPTDYAAALGRLHQGMRTLDVTVPHFTDRVAQAQELVAARDRTPALPDAERELLARTMRECGRRIGVAGRAEQLLHGEPHPGNVLRTRAGPLFIDLETCCRGPVEFDAAHVPVGVCAHYPDLDQALLDECRGLVLAMVAAWRWDVGDQLPDGQRAAEDLLDVVRKGPPWPTLDAVGRRAPSA